jgi:hypothetical protein
MPEIIKTYIAPLLTSDKRTIVQPEGEAPIYWLDEFLKGGFLRPDGLGRPLVILLSGPPGAGKSILAQHICYNRALAANAGLEVRKARSLYITTETSGAAIAENMESLGLGRKDIGAGYYTHDSFCHGGAWAKEGEHQGREPLMMVTHEALPGQAEALEGGGGDRTTSLKEFMARMEDAWKLVSGRGPQGNLPSPWVVVIDGLNCVRAPQDRDDLLGMLAQMFRDANGCMPQCVFFVLDCLSDGRVHGESQPAWGYLADINIRLDHAYAGGEYFTRSMEISKARYQSLSHGLGKRLLKIYDPPEDSPDPEGAGPNRKTGGIFVFPSIHYVLSRVRKSKPLVKVDVKRPALTWGAPPDYKGSKCAPSGKGGLAPPCMEAEARLWVSSIGRRCRA